MALDDEIAKLFQVPLPDFIQERQRLVVELKRAGQTAEAAAVKSLAKPARSAWLVNQVFWQSRSLFDALVGAGERLRRAQHARLGGDTGASVVRAMEARDLAVEAAVRAAEEQARAHGEALSAEQRQRVRVTLEALAARPLADLKVVPGRLAEDLGPSGFDALTSLMPQSVMGRVLPMPVAVRQGTASPSRQPEPFDRAARSESARAAARRQVLEAAVTQAEAERARAARDADEAGQAAEGAASVLLAARAALDALETRLADLRRQREAAVQTVDQATRAMSRAEQEHRDAIGRRASAEQRLADRRAQMDR